MTEAPESIDADPVEIEPTETEQTDTETPAIVDESGTDNPSGTETDSVATEQEPDSPELWVFLEVLNRSEDHLLIHSSDAPHSLNYLNGAFVGGDTVTYRLRVQNLGAAPVVGVILQGYSNGAGAQPVLTCALANNSAAPVNVTDGSLNLRSGEKIECGAQYTLVDDERGHQWPITYSVAGSASVGGDDATPVDIAMISDPALGPSVTSASVEWGVRFAHDYPELPLEPETSVAPPSGIIIDSGGVAQGTPWAASIAILLVVAGFALLTGSRKSLRGRASRPWTA